MSQILVITTSLRKCSNSDILAERLCAGVRDGGGDVELISLKDKQIAFCRGCLACQKTGKCVIDDDAVAIAAAVKDATKLVFVTPIYYYEMSGQLKTLLDRLNPLYAADYRFRDVYMVTVAAEDEDFVAEKAVSGLKGWIDCFPKASFGGSLFRGGLTDGGDAADDAKSLEDAYRFGRSLL